MGRWAQRQKRGGGGLPSLPVAAPVLVATEPNQLDWTWSDADPDAWVISKSDDGVSGWIDFDTAGGVDRTFGAVDPTKFYRIYGQTTGDPSTGVSNVVSF